MFSRGGLKGRFVSVLIIKWVAERWERAAVTCGELNAGFRGTWERSVLAWEFLI